MAMLAGLSVWHIRRLIASDSFTYKFYFAKLSNKFNMPISDELT